MFEHEFRIVVELPASEGESQTELGITARRKPAAGPVKEGGTEAAGEEIG
jgi:hypothetical protein